MTSIIASLTFLTAGILLVNTGGTAGQSEVNVFPHSQAERSLREGRILAQYGAQKAQNTLEALGKLGEVVSSLGNVKDAVVGVRTSNKANDDQIVAKLEELNLNLVDGSQVVSSLNSIWYDLADILIALVDDDSNTILGQLSSTNSLLKEKLSSIESILSYGNITTPALR